MKIRSRVATFALLVVALAANPAFAQKKSVPADTVILHAKIYTLNSKQPWAEAVAIRGERILAVASDVDIAKLQTKDSKVMDAKGRLLLPGFTDCHIHFLAG